MTNAERAGNRIRPVVLRVRPGQEHPRWCKPRGGRKRIGHSWGGYPTRCFMCGRWESQNANAKGIKRSENTIGSNARDSGGET